MSAEPRPSLRALIATAALCGAVLALAAVLTHTPIRRHAHTQALAQLAGVLPPGSYDNDPLADRILLDDSALGTTVPQPLLRARRQGQAAALVVEAVAEQGYGGPIRLQIGIARDGRLLGVRVLAHAETPGWGDAYAHPGGWLQQLQGRSLQDPAGRGWATKRDGGVFDQIGAATVTPRAILRRVHAVLAAYAERGEAWFAASAPP